MALEFDTFSSSDTILLWYVLHSPDMATMNDPFIYTINQKKARFNETQQYTFALSEE